MDADHLDEADAAWVPQRAGRSLSVRLQHLHDEVGGALGGAGPLRSRPSWLSKLLCVEFIHQAIKLSCLLRVSCGHLGRFQAPKKSARGTSRSFREISQRQRRYAWGGEQSLTSWRPRAGHLRVHPVSIEVRGADECYEVDCRTGAGDQLVCFQRWGLGAPAACGLLQKHGRPTDLKPRCDKALARVKKPRRRRRGRENRRSESARHAVGISAHVLGLGLYRSRFCDKMPNTSTWERGRAKG
jgi:hypothetical protein